ncbi:hypothetical protein PGT21_009401 [Puccinia graminis f. sp. tritici]|uniref:Uncharacterized protein n=1 Tax=Puccinia graminis f. sp. tritici TaxID=56615 RepID=A0A5B0LL32_PUCGR|nr:hypothetical protein PGT21_009401 [Puccinia graminis f. sp. tritici]KAA1122975.1 hypothetical protein PGTUg99_011964 [Puccinia graminis f. sp. tritici]
MQNPLSYQWMTNNNKSIRLLSSFLGFFDIKLGVTIICLISLLNKVVGFYGILAVFHGANLIQMMNPDAPRLSPELRKQAAQAIWKEEQGFASGILGLVWLTKLYFIFVVYSFALHLRRGTYTALPLSRPPSTISTSTRLRGVSRSLNPNSSAYTYSQLRNPNGTLPLASPSSSDLPVFRPQLDDIHPLEIQSVPTELSLNPGKLS